MWCFPCSKGAAFAFLAVQAVIVVIILYVPTSSISTLAITPQSLQNALVIVTKPEVRRNFSNARNGSYLGGTIGIDRFPDLTKLVGVERLSAPKLPRAVSGTDYQTLMRLLSLTIKVLEEHNVGYVLAYGSLIGSYVMHDILPWDDDIDVFIHNASKAKVMEIFQNDSHYGIQGYHYLQSSGQLYKIFFNHSNGAGTYKWKWPFIDIVSYIERGNSIIPVEKSAKSRFAIPRSSFYPFHKRPFGPLWVNAPRDPVVLFRAKYKSFYCKSGFWNHQKETDRKVLHEACSKLRQYYPFVKRRGVGGRTEETLLLNDVPQYKIVVGEPYHESKTIYGW